jgi:hypothetical protein
MGGRAGTGCRGAPRQKAALKNLRAQHISAAYANALESGRRKDGGGLSARTVQHIHRVLKQVLAQAVQWEMIARNPAANVKPPKVPANPIAHL